LPIYRFLAQDACLALNLVPFILQSLIMLGIIIAMNFSVTQLRAMVSNSPWVPSTPLQVVGCFLARPCAPDRCANRSYHLTVHLLNFCTDPLILSSHHAC
jgi:hypothetical protein